MWSTAAGFTVSTWVAAVRPDALAVIVAVPDRVSLYLKLALLVPVAIVTLVIVAVSAVLRNVPPVEPVERETVTLDVAVTGDPLFAWSWTVMVADVVPAVRVWAPVVNASFWAGGAASAAVANEPRARAIVSRQAIDAETRRGRAFRTGETSNSTMLRPECQ
jgi:hypothetical protein